MPDILLVEDDAEQARVVGAALAAGGYRVETCGDGPSALAAAERAWPELVLLDINIPGCDGYDVCRALRSMETSERRVTIVLATVRHDTASKLLGFAAGADDYLLKPLDVRELRSRVARWLGSRAVQDERAKRRRTEAIRDVVAAVAREIDDPLQAAFRAVDVVLSAGQLDAERQAVLSDARGQLVRLSDVLRLLRQVENRRVTSD